MRNYRGSHCVGCDSRAVLIEDEIKPLNEGDRVDRWCPFCSGERVHVIGELLFPDRAALADRVE